MSIRDEELIDYLLDEGNAELVRRVEAALDSDPQIAQRLQELRAALGLLDSLKSSIEPPSDLLSRTLNFIDQSGAPAPLEPSSSGSSSQRNFVRLRPGDIALETRSRRSAWDSAFLTVSVAAMACLMLPLMLQGRSLSRQNQCANNLRFLGQNVTQLAMLDLEHRFPAVPLAGEESFAGRFVLKLRDKGLLDSSLRLHCVSIPGTDTAGPKVVCIPTTKMFLDADTVQQALWRNELGGDYAYNFGVIENDRIVGPKLEGRTHFAILADAPQIDADRDVFYAHEGRGTNIYYEDGHVGFSNLPRCATSEGRPAFDRTDESIRNRKAIVRSGDWSAAQDYPFRNLAGQPTYGLQTNDAALGRSSSIPKLQ